MSELEGARGWVNFEPDDLDGAVPGLWSYLASRGALTWFHYAVFAHVITCETLALACDVGMGVEPQCGWPTFLSDLERLGVVVPEQVTIGAVTGRRAVLIQRVRDACAARVVDESTDLNRMRAQMLAAGIAKNSGALAGQLTLWARELQAWPELMMLWRRYWAELWGPSRDLAIQAYASIPDSALRKHPELAYVAASYRTFESDHVKGDVWRVLVHDGDFVFPGWSTAKELDVAVGGATLRIGAQFAAGDFEAATATVRSVSQRIKAAALSNQHISARAYANFSVYAGTATFLAGDIRASLAHTEAALTGALDDEFASPVASGLRVLIFASVGDFARYEEAHGEFERREIVTLPHAELASLPVRIGESLVASGRLDRQGAESALARARAFSQGSELWFAYAWARARIDALWGDPVQALARLDGDSIAHASHLEQAGLPRRVVTRARAEILLKKGRVNRALALIEASSETAATRRWLLVTHVRALLSANEYERSIRLAETGVDHALMTICDRGSLYALKAHALHLLGKRELAAAAARTAALLSIEVGCVLPLVDLPAELRHDVFARFGADTDVTSWIFSDTTLPRRISAVYDTPSGATLVALTRRERVLLPLLATDATAAEIAEKLVVSVNTVRKQVVTLRAKFGVADRAALVARACELSLLSIDDDSAPPSGARRRGTRTT